MKKVFIVIGIGVVVVIAAVFILSGRDTWTGFYYPDLDKIDDQSTWRLSPPLKSLDECRAWVNSVKHGFGDDDYSCGRNCRFTTEYIGETVICETDSK